MPGGNIRIPYSVNDLMICFWAGDEYGYGYGMEVLCGAGILLRFFVSAGELDRSVVYWDMFAGGAS
jgi:hypothetical protein